MQADTSPVPAYLRSGLLPHPLSICTPHLWARTLLSLFRSSARQWQRDNVKRSRTALKEQQHKLVDSWTEQDELLDTYVCETLKSAMTQKYWKLSFQLKDVFCGTTQELHECWTATPHWHSSLCSPRLLWLRNKSNPDVFRLSFVLLKCASNQSWCSYC